MHLDPIERLNLTFSAGAVAAGWVLHSPAFASSLALGAAIEAVNFRSLRSGAQRLLAGELTARQVSTVLFGLRFVALGAAIAFALRAGAHPAGLVIGLSCIVPATLLGAWLQRPPILPPGPGLPPDDPSWDRYSVWLGRERPISEDEEEDEA